MSIDVWLLYVGTVLVFMIAPGPSHLMMLSVSMSNGFPRSLATAAGDLSANSLQILLAGLGLATVIELSGLGFVIIKWLGIAYLIWLGVRQIVVSYRRTTESPRPERASLRNLWLRGFISSAANPKAVVFFAALFPQFVDTQAALAPQIAVLGISYLVIDGLFLSAYGKGASWITDRLHSRHEKWLQRAAGGSLIAAAVLLGIKR